MPKVLDIDGTLIRLGFKGHTTLRDGQFYQRNVPLFNGGVKAGYNGRRVSHAQFCMRPVDSGGTGGSFHIKAYYGYPSSRMKKKKLLMGFRCMTSETSYSALYLTDDLTLMVFEQNMQELLNLLLTCRINTTGSDLKERTPHGALAYKVQECFDTIANRKQKWHQYATPACDFYVDEPDQVEPVRSTKTRLKDRHSRLPAHVGGHVFRHTVRPR